MMHKVQTMTAERHLSISAPYLLNNVNQWVGQGAEEAEPEFSESRTPDTNGLFGDQLAVTFKGNNRRLVLIQTAGFSSERARGSCG